MPAVLGRLAMRATRRLDHLRGVEAKARLALGATRGEGMYKPVYTSRMLKGEFNAPLMCVVG